MYQKVEWLNKIFEKQIEKNEKFKVHKELFNLTLDFTMKDWRFIRTKKYWNKIGELPYDSQKKYTLECVKYYLNNYR